MDNAGDSDALLEASTQIDSSDWRDDDDADNYITARLYRAANGKHFRYIESSGMNSSYAGAGNIVEWLAPGDVATWNAW
jgi:hypothetical protein